MKLLIITQKVDQNDPILGFFHRWIEEFAKHVESLTVICLGRGKYNLPINVKVLSLGKENGASRPKYLWNFYKYLWQERNNYDRVFVHMNPIYIVLAGIYWRLIHKNTALWYTHKNIDWKLRIAEKLVNIIFTASAESFRLSSKKLIVTGHGIDLDQFKPLSQKKQNYPLSIVTAGRISKTKNIDLLAETALNLKNKGFCFEIRLAGRAITKDDENYLFDLKKSIEQLGLSKKFFFVGSIPNTKINQFYQAGDIFVNLSQTGSMDKAILEAMACGIKVLTANEAFVHILPRENIVSLNPEEISEKILEISKTDNDLNSSHYVSSHHDLKKLIRKIVDHLR